MLFFFRQFFQPFLGIATPITKALLSHTGSLALAGWFHGARVLVF